MSNTSDALLVDDNAKVMLACDAVLDKIVFPVWGSIKFDGIRAYVKKGVVYSRSNKPIPNKAVQEKYGKPEYEGYDGELIVGDIYDEDCFRKTTSIVMSHDKPADDVVFYVFDTILHKDADFGVRYEAILKNCSLGDGVVLVEHTLINNLDELNVYVEVQANLGGEGVILRAPDQTYKFGRSTVRGGHLLRIKFFVESEFLIVGINEQFKNNNEAVVNELGRTSRSTSKANLTPMGTFGSFTLKMPDSDLTFNCGTGFTDKLRDEIWRHPECYMHQWAKIKYLDVGSKNVPRIPSFKGIRNPIDMGE